MRMSALCCVLALAAAPAPLMAQQAGGAEATLQYVQDRLAIEDLLSRYAVAMDSGDYETYAALFAEDAELIFANTHLTGRAAILETMRPALERSNGGADGAGRLRHLLSGVSITIDGDTATARANWATVSARSGAPAIGAMGYYDDTLVRRDGRWMFQRRNIVTELAAGPPPGGQ